MSNGLARLQIYSISQQLARDPANASLKAHIEEMKRLKSACACITSPRSWRVDSLPHCPVDLHFPVHSSSPSQPQWNVSMQYAE